VGLANREAKLEPRQRALKRERVEARLTPEHKALVHYAAALTGTSVSDFVATSATTRAEAVVRERQVLPLTAEDSLFFAQVVLDPPPASERLRAAATRHDELLRSTLGQARFVVEQFDRKLRAAAQTFSCGDLALDDYLRTRAEKDMRHRVAVPYVLWDTERRCLVGFYTFSTASVEPTNLLPEVARLLPRSQAIPIIVLVLGRQAISDGPAYRGQGYGEMLLVDALRRARDLSRDLGAVGVIADATAERDPGMYEALGFVPFPHSSLRLFMAMATIAELT
jgi:uncharacterized protein (DUF1778 family)/GNAT superfamily N-acetyltransferase